MGDWNFVEFLQDARPNPHGLPVEYKLYWDAWRAKHSLTELHQDELT